MVAAVDSSKSAGSVLAVAVRAGAAVGARAEAFHVRAGGRPPVEVADAAGIPLTTLEGDPVSSILDVLSAPDVVLGVIGARREAADYRFAGSIAAAIIARSPTPLIVVGPHVRHPSQRLSRVLVPLDGTAQAADAVHDVIALFTAPDVDVVVHHVFDRTTVPACWDQPQHAQESWAREFLARWYDRPGATLTWQRGDAADAILDATAQEGADLIALAWGQDSSPGHATVVKNALLRASVPILLVPTRSEPLSKLPLLRREPSTESGDHD